MIWNWLITTLAIFVLSWISAGVLIQFTKAATALHRIAKFIPLVGNLAILIFIVLLWNEIERPPMRTMAETRLWYSFFLSWVIWLIYLKTRGKIIYWLGFIMAVVFLIIDIIHPEYQSKALMPALQSPWFIPHVVIYMIAYAVLAAASMNATIGLIRSNREEINCNQELLLSLKLVYIGQGLLTLGMLMGALWAKIAWGNYWSWDPKENWALLTWLFYLIIIHINHRFPTKSKVLLWLIACSIVVLAITWLGIKYVAPNMQSVHIYGG